MSNVLKNAEMERNSFSNAMMAITKMEMDAQETVKSKMDSLAQVDHPKTKILAIFSDQTGLQFLRQDKSGNPQALY